MKRSKRLIAGFMVSGNGADTITDCRRSKGRDPEGGNYSGRKRRAGRDGMAGRADLL